MCVCVRVYVHGRTHTGTGKAIQPTHTIFKVHSFKKNSTIFKIHSFLWMYAQETKFVTFAT